MDLPESFGDAIHEISEKINNLKVSTDQNSEQLIEKLIESLHNISEQSRCYGVPPPKDSILDYSASIISESCISVYSSVDDNCSVFSNVSEIKTINQDIKIAVQETLQTFKNTSKEYLSNSIITYARPNTLVNELENMKNVLSNEIFEKLQESEMESSVLSNMKSVHSMQVIYQQIFEIQEEIIRSSKELFESEQMIKKTNSETSSLLNQLQNLEKSLNHIIISEETEPNSASCRCVIA